MAAATSNTNSTIRQSIFTASLSGRYEVACEEWNGIKLEVYYLMEQPWNVPRNDELCEEVLDYFIKNFGPYEHKEARIVEFPRVATLAESFPDHALFRIHRLYCQCRIIPTTSILFSTS